MMSHHYQFLPSCIHYQIYHLLHLSEVGKDGKPGRPGNPGKDGAPGKPGYNGRPGENADLSRAIHLGQLKALMQKLKLVRCNRKH